MGTSNRFLSNKLSQNFFSVIVSIRLLNISGDPELNFIPQFVNDNLYLFALCEIENILLVGAMLTDFVGASS